MTDPASTPEPDESSSGRGRGRTLLTAAVIALLLALGIGTWLVIWWRGGGARRAITELAEEGAVKLADTVLDEVLGAA